MEIARAIQIVQLLADGVDPLTGETFPFDSPYQNPETVRALHLASRGLYVLDQRNKRKERLPQNAGKPWTNNEDEEVISRFRGGATIKEIASEHMRTDGAILSRLVKLGEIAEE